VAQLASLDMNLILVLRELLRERNVTRAAERVGVTQPAMSAALSRLRRHFGDELLVRVSRGYVLSPLATQLERQVEEICAAAEQLFATGADFSPDSSRREFTLMMADYTVAVLGSRLSQLFEAEAPHASLHIRLVREALALEMPHLIRWVDGIVAPETRQALPLLRSAELFRDEWVCVASADSELPSGDSLTLEDLADASWVVPFHRNQGSPPASPAPPVTRQLAMLGIRPRVAIGVESYVAVPHMITGTGRVTGGAGEACGYSPALETRIRSSRRCGGTRTWTRTRRTSGCGTCSPRWRRSCEYQPGLYLAAITVILHACHLNLWFSLSRPASRKDSL
jgi:DNA-binding transcriptional LysR family regulator